MSEVRPFRGFRFNEPLEPLLAGPYDVIAPEERDRLAEQPHSIVHLTLPPGESEARDYELAARTLKRWIRERVLSPDSKECLYVLEETTEDGRVRKGFIANVRLADYSERVILPHERTMRGPKQDRLLLTREVRANLEPLFFLYEDRENRLGEIWTRQERAAAVAECTGPDGTRLRMWADSDPSRIALVREHLRERSLIIADGHHRYETMVAYRDECRREAGRDAGPAEFVMAYLVNAFDPGSKVQAIHRVLRGSTADPIEVARSCGFECESGPSAETGDDLVRALAPRAGSECAFILVESGGRTTLVRRPRDKQLDVEVLHSELLPPLGGELSFDARPNRLLDTCRSGGAALGILLNPIAPEVLFRVVQAGAILPQKSTYFAPKIPTGLVLRSFDAG